MKPRERFGRTRVHAALQLVCEVTYNERIGREH
jgi:hypothetical protein